MNKYSAVGEEKVEERTKHTAVRACSTQLFCVGLVHTTWNAIKLEPAH